MPKMVEVDEVELQNMQALRGTISKALQNPKARVLLEQAHKMVDPSAPTPTIDAHAAASAPVDEAKKLIEEWKKEEAERRTKEETERKISALTSTVDKGLAKLRDEGYTEEGIKSVQKIMDEHGILDPMVAAAYHEKLHPPAAPSTPGGQGAWNFMADLNPDTDANLQKLIETKGENNLVIDRMAHDALLEVRGQSRR